MVSFMYPCVSMCGACAGIGSVNVHANAFGVETPDIAATDTALSVGLHTRVSSGDTCVRGSMTLDPQTA